MKIVVLDKLPLDQGDLDWAPYEALGDVTYYDRTSPEQLLERIKGAQVLASNKVLLTKETLAQCPDLQFVQIMATGTNIIDFDQANAQGVKIANIPSYSTASVVQHCFALLFQMMRDVGGHSATVHGGKWHASPDFCYFEQRLDDIEGKRWTIVGAGEIGLAVAKAAESFGALVTFAQLPGRPASPGKVMLDELLPNTDVLSLHCPLSDLTQDLMNEQRFRSLPKEAYFLNLARGPIVVEADLAQVLAEGHLAGVATDVLVNEPPEVGNPLIGAPRCLITPHAAWGSTRARRRLLSIMVENLKVFQETAQGNLES